jgi:DNA modification methylase
MNPIKKEDYTLYNNDCFNVFNKIKEKSVQLVIVDLPYGAIGCKWDVCIDLDKMWIELKKICIKNCLYVFFCTTKFGVSIINSNPKFFKYDLVWHKSRKVGFLSANKMPLRAHEMLYVFGGGGKKIYNPQKTTGHKPFKVNGGISLSNSYYRGNGEKYSSLSQDNKGTRHPYSILKYNNPTKPIHKTQKPVDLIEWLIKSYSNEGDTILDYTMGSGSTGIACLNTNRKFIGIEKNEEIFKIAEDRLKNHKLNIF